MPLVVTCGQCHKEVLEADLIGDDEECLLRDHVLALRPKDSAARERSRLLRHFVVTEPIPPAE